ncbi:GMC family oxidoreductase (plasmid) [Mesorhizobium sp. ORM8.1]
MGAFDYIIVGGGSAGCVIAHRLVVSGASVCVIEAGPADNNPFIRMPAGFIKTMFNPALTWQFKTERSDWTGGRQISVTQGRTLGGSSAINGMLFVRGQAEDYNVWAQLGNSGWSYQDVLPYFRRLEQRIGAGADEDYRGFDGPLPVTDGDWRHPLCDAFIDGARGLGFPDNPDYNGESQAGVGYYQRVIHRTRRVSAAHAYLHPVMNNPHLSVVTGAQVTSIVLDGKRAAGVTFRRERGGQVESVTVRKEVVICAGAINSPKLLQLSGIGDPELLQTLGIAVKHPLRGVGRHLSDHYSVRIVAKVRNTETINNLVTGPRLLGQVARWALRRPSVLGLSAAIVYAFGSSDPAMEQPDYTVIFTPASYKHGKIGTLDAYPGMTCGVWQMRPESTGQVAITSPDPAADPAIQLDYLKEQKDQQVLLSALRMARRILESEPLRPYYDTEQLPGAGLTGDDDLLRFAREYGTTAFHLCGSCRMGPASDPANVVDNGLRVHGIDALRVADSSILPRIVSANTYATSVMIGEKAADFLLGKPAA